MLFINKITDMLNPLNNKKVEVKFVKDDKKTVVLPTGPTAPAAISADPKNSTPIVEEGILLTKSDILTAVVVLTLVNGAVAMGIASIVKDND